MFGIRQQKGATSFEVENGPEPSGSLGCSFLATQGFVAESLCDSRRGTDAPIGALKVRLVARVTGRLYAPQMKQAFGLQCRNWG